MTAFTSEPAFANRMVTVLVVALPLGAKLTTIELGETRETDGAAGVAKVWVTVMTGDLARVVSVPPDVDFSVAIHVAAPTPVVAVAPGPLAPVAPDFMVRVAPAARVTPSTTMV